MRESRVSCVMLVVKEELVQRLHQGLTDSKKQVSMAPTSLAPSETEAEKRSPHPSSAAAAADAAAANIALNFGVERLLAGRKTGGKEEEDEDSDGGDRKEEKGMQEEMHRPNAILLICLFVPDLHLLFPPPPPASLPFPLPLRPQPTRPGVPPRSSPPPSSSQFPPPLLLHGLYPTTTTTTANNQTQIRSTSASSGQFRKFSIALVTISSLKAENPPSFEQPCNIFSSMGSNGQK